MPDMTYATTPLPANDLTDEEMDKARERVLEYVSDPEERQEVLAMLGLAPV